MFLKCFGSSNQHPPAPLDTNTQWKRTQQEVVPSGGESLSGLVQSAAAATLKLSDCQRAGLKLTQQSLRRVSQLLNIAPYGTQRELRQCSALTVDQQNKMLTATEDMLTAKRPGPTLESPSDCELSVLPPVSPTVCLFLRLFVPEKTRRLFSFGRADQPLEPTEHNSVIIIFFSVGLDCNIVLRLTCSS